MKEKISYGFGMRKMICYNELIKRVALTGLFGPRVLTFAKGNSL